MGGQHQGIARILTRQRCRDVETLGLIDGHVLGAVDRDVHRLVEQRVFDLLDEQTLGAGLAERPGLQPIAVRFDGDDLDLRAGLLEEGSHSRGLPEGEAAAAGPDPNRRAAHERGALLAGPGAEADRCCSSAASRNRRFSASA